MKIFGQYLFATLVGENVWQQILNEAGNDSIEIEISVDEVEVSRVPWETMHDWRNFLAAGQISITRIVESERQPGKIKLQPRVLFVAGTEPNDPSIRPGAEFLAL